jgi:hypothetical protein
MRTLLLALSLGLAFTGAASAFDDPKALMQAIYAPYIEGRKAPDPDQYYSSRLKVIYAKNLAGQVKDPASGESVDTGAPAILSFDPFIEGQHSLLLDVAITDPVLSGKYAVANVSFHNFDHASLLSVSLVKEDDGWKVDDIASLGNEQKWLLSWLLQYDPFSVK